MKAIEKPWIENGYRSFAYLGPNGLKIEQIAKQVGKNKSSFYHLFADLEVFIKRLLNYHIHQTKIAVEKEVNANTEIELIDILLEHKIDLLFNRQLRIHRNKIDFEKCFNYVDQISNPGLLSIWKKAITLEDNTPLAQMLLNLSIENFYLQITDDILTKTWLANYFVQMRTMVNRFKQTGSEMLLNDSL